MGTRMDPHEARRFADLLVERAADIRRLDSTVSRKLLELTSGYWDDAKHRQFAKRYEESSVLLQTFAGQAERYAEYLRRKAAPLDRYLDRNY